MQPAALYVTVTILAALGGSASANTTLRTVSDGDGPVMLFVHGSISDHRAWDPICASIPMDRLAVAYDMRHFGKAD